METIITTLWNSGILGGIATGIITFLGQLIALNVKKFQDVLTAVGKAQKGDIAAHDAAFKREPDGGGVWMRRVMLFMAFFMIGICPVIFAAFLKEVPIIIETSSQSGGWLWGLFPEKETIEMISVKGLYLAEVWKDLFANLISAYIGSGITRKAFQVGR
jgi:hypothetical protein